MAVGRKKIVIQGVKKVMSHGEFIDRIRKSLYLAGSDELEISSPLAEYASELFSEPHKNHSLNRLNKVAAGNSHASPCSLIMALIYLDRLNATDSNYVRRITPSELFIVSMMISTKFYSGVDEDFYLSDWAKDGNMTEERIKELELEFLCAINWNIYISNENFFKKLKSVEKTLAQREGLRRGWLTYTELLNFLPTFTMAKFLLNNITIMAVSYAASVMTIAGAFFLVSNIPGNGILKVNREKILNTNKNLLELHGDIDRNTNENNDSSNSNIKKNLTCSAINIEEEMQQLENQYNQEEQNEILLNKNNENSGPLVNSNQNIMLPIDWRLDITSGFSWNFLKGDRNDNKNYNHVQNYDRINDYGLIKTQNFTKTIFWDILSDAAQNSFDRIPFLWFKFM